MLCPISHSQLWPRSIRWKPQPGSNATIAHTDPQPFRPKTSTWWGKTESKTQGLRFYWQKQYPNSEPLAPPLHSWEKTGTLWILLLRMPQTLRPVQACVITHSYVNNKGTNWQNYRLGFLVKWPADITKLSPQLQHSSDNVLPRKSNFFHVLKPFNFQPSKKTTPSTKTQWPDFRLLLLTITNMRWGYRWGDSPVPNLAGFVCQQSWWWRYSNRLKFDSLKNSRPVSRLCNFHQNVQLSRNFQLSSGTVKLIEPPPTFLAQLTPNLLCSISRLSPTNDPLIGWIIYIYTSDKRPTRN